MPVSVTAHVYYGTVLSSKAPVSEILATPFHLVTTSSSIPVSVGFPCRDPTLTFSLGRALGGKLQEALSFSVIHFLFFLFVSFAIFKIILFFTFFLSPTLSLNSSLPSPGFILSEYYCMDQAAFELMIPLP